MQSYDWISMINGEDLTDDEQWVKTLVQKTLEMLKYRFDFDEDAQAQKEILVRTVMKIESLKMRKEYVKKLAPCRQVMENFLQVHKVQINDQNTASYGLSKKS